MSVIQASAAFRSSGTRPRLEHRAPLARWWLPRNTVGGLVPHGAEVVANSLF